MAPVFSQFQPDGERYRSLNLYLKKLFGEKVYKVTLNGGMTCPNRDGHIGTGGCIFCSAMGSGDFAGNASLSITEQLREGKDAIRKKRPVRKFIAYFQAFTNTYAPVDHLEKIFTEAINDPDVCALSIATRPDCLPPAVLELLGRLNRIKPVWVELGLQTVNSETARFIRRGYPTDVFDHAVHRLRMLGITVIVHVILFLPYETKEMMFHTIDHLNKLDIQSFSQGSCTDALYCSTANPRDILKWRYLHTPDAFSLPFSHQDEYSSVGLSVNRCIFTGFCISLFI